MNTLATSRTSKVTVSPAGTVGQNMPIAFGKDSDGRAQAPPIDSGELYYNPSKKNCMLTNSQEVSSVLLKVKRFN